MDLSKLRNITNQYQDVRLISLRDWRRVVGIEPHDQAGPYVIAQQGYDPKDPKLTPLDFVLGKTGEGVRVEMFYSLPLDTRRAEFIFSSAAEVMELMQSLPTQVKVVRSGKELSEQVEAPASDELNAAVLEASKDL